MAQRWALLLAVSVYDQFSVSGSRAISPFIHTAERQWCVSRAGPSAGGGSMAQSASVESFASGTGGLARAGGTKKVRKAGGVVWDGLEADGKRLKLVR